LLPVEEEAGADDGRSPLDERDGGLLHRRRLLDAAGPVEGHRRAEQLERLLPRPLLGPDRRTHERQVRRDHGVLYARLDVPGRGPVDDRHADPLLAVRVVADAARALRRQGAVADHELGVLAPDGERGDGLGRRPRERDPGQHDAGATCRPREAGTGRRRGAGTTVRWRPPGAKSCPRPRCAPGARRRPGAPRRQPPPCRRPPHSWFSPLSANAAGSNSLGTEASIASKKSNSTSCLMRSVTRVAPVSESTASAGWSAVPMISAIPCSSSKNTTAPREVMGPSTTVTLPRA